MPAFDIRKPPFHRKTPPTYHSHRKLLPALWHQMQPLIPQVQCLDEEREGILAERVRQRDSFAQMMDVDGLLREESTCKGIC
ncbi:predicted protein [Plenodomus lingam JN3]|uniref:Predicted protein n=1 Tax=Leptosphaeria maculans (strain JN3 / isolate v23.1.3 / race Av1-4-5-6-7-8) TaxID=985895 RepID=E4ZW17_LEPMJ|nr:predicted protein [Plenodomus lingam JN3]CBX95793.1 predicted protein [Plenodomus lingam JN3]